MEIRHYYDEIEELHYWFLSDATQETIDSLSFTGFWSDVKRILVNTLNYTVIEIDRLNRN